MFRFLVPFLISLMILAPAWAEMRIKDPLDYPLKTYALILGASLLGGIVSWVAKVRKGEIPPWSINYLVGELVTSAFAGLLCFWICEWAGSPPLLTAALAGVAGHMGAKAITMIEEWGVKRAQKVMTP